MNLTDEQERALESHHNLIVDEQEKQKRMLASVRHSMKTAYENGQWIDLMSLRETERAIEERVDALGLVRSSCEILGRDIGSKNEWAATRAVS